MVYELNFQTPFRHPESTLNTASQNIENFNGLCCFPPLCYLSPCKKSSPKGLKGQFVILGCGGKSRPKGDTIKSSDTDHHKVITLPQTVQLIYRCERIPNIYVIEQDKIRVPTTGQRRALVGIRNDPAASRSNKCLSYTAEQKMEGGRNDARGDTVRSGCVEPVGQEDAELIEVQVVVYEVHLV